MRAVTFDSPGDPDVLSLSELPDPVAGPGEVLIRVAAAGVNRADLSQREGAYPPPAGAPTHLGLEVSGTVAAVGDGATRWSVGDRVCALLAGGGYAELVTVDERHVLPVPEGLDLVEAAGLPEVVATVWSNVMLDARLQPGETLLVHGGSSGIGTMAIQLATRLGARVAVTAGSPAKLEACRALGADILIDYRQQDFVEELRAATDGHGADVILDAIAGDYIDRDIRALARDGRIMVIGAQSGAPTSIAIGQLMARRGRIWGTTLRARDADDKARIVDAIRADVWPAVADGSVRPIVDRVFPLAEAAAAHAHVASSQHVGKVLLAV
ncbi:Phthiocerol synthesis polyketide synthase type I PpsC [Clavibacter michiganensis]|uniref:Phthiocerol synthesis polyketide synthase type I PpsC n=1 Tax=Clavibacter michiganensis TaxID=28447 RepID=A0A251Y217_9MICO|nr:NAD(P)H-quinone oxidoreductase [Clavibacter michiganensis]OUE18344.1 Phthiocerol synthesis polyketide synthase type I PpsC [Clavibacter michiganensis]